MELLSERQSRGIEHVRLEAERLHRVLAQRRARCRELRAAVEDAVAIAVAGASDALKCGGSVRGRGRALWSRVRDFVIHRGVSGIVSKLLKVEVETDLFHQERRRLLRQLAREKKQSDRMQHAALTITRWDRKPDNR